MFLSGGGMYAHADPRRTSVAAAIEFAASARLEGLVLHTQALLLPSGGGGPEALSSSAAHEVLRAATTCGLHVMTYGELNNDPAWVRQQRALGVLGVIVDDVAGVAAALGTAAAAATLVG